MLRIFIWGLLFGAVLRIDGSSYSSEEKTDSFRSVFNAITSISGSTESENKQHTRRYHNAPTTSSENIQNFGTHSNNGHLYGNNYKPLRYIDGYASGTLVPVDSNIRNRDGSQGFIQDGGPSVFVHNFGNGYQPNGYSDGTHAGYLYENGFQQPSHTSGNTNENIAPAYQAGYSHNSPQHTQNGYRHPNQNQGYQGNRGFSTLDHSLKENTEYREVGHHNGPFQRYNVGLGYGSGYDGYNGAFNRPGI